MSNNSLKKSSRYVNHNIKEYYPEMHNELYYLKYIHKFIENMSGSGVDYTPLLTSIETILSNISSSDCNTAVATTICNVTDITNPITTLLQSIYQAVDELEVKADNIILEADEISLNTDTLELLLQDLLQSIVMYQKTKCDGTPIGSPIAVQQTVVVAPVEAKICNIDALAEALYAASPKYNKPKHKEVLSGNSEVIAAGTLNELEVIVRGNVTISIDGINVVYTSGVYKFNADELMNSDFTITPIAPSSAIIKTKS